MASTKPGKATSAFSAWLDDARLRLDTTKVLGKSLTWYVTGWRFGVIALIACILLPLIPWLMGYYSFLAVQGLLVDMTSVWVFVMLALGLNVVVGYAGLLDLGYVAFYVIGSYTYAAGTQGFLHDWSSGSGTFTTPTFNIWVLIAIGAILAAFFGVLLGAPTLRLRGDYLAIVTLGFGEIVPIVFQNLPTFYGNIGMSAIPPAALTILGFTIDFQDPLNNVPFYILALIITALITMGVLALRDSSVGRAWIAIREDETAAEASGINLTRTKLLAFGIGAFVGGVGGVVHTALVPAIAPMDFNFQLSITVLVMIVLGGIGSVPGVIVGAIILELIDIYALGALDTAIHGSSFVAAATSPLHFLANFEFNGTFKFLIYGILLLLMILLRPQGLIPDGRRRRELKGIGAAPEDISAVGAMELVEAGVDAPALDTTRETTVFTGDGSDAQGREG